METYFTNPIISGYPTTICIDGYDRRIETGFRYWLQLYSAFQDDSLTEAEKLYAVYDLTGLEIGENPQADLDAVLEFLSADAMPHKRSGSNKRTFDFNYDSAEIIASFIADYGIDLTDKNTQLHWWLFMALFRGLSENTPIMQLIKLRTTEEPKGNDPETRKRREVLRKAQRENELPVLSYKDALAREKEIWGD